MRPRPLRSLSAVALALVGWLFLRAAWLSDDAFITLRVADNLVHGYGPRWNVMERVQVYTHPLWLAVLLPFYALTREPLYTVALLQIAIMLLSLGLAAREIARTAGAGHALAFVVLCAGSRSVVSYATSGLENPLALLLLVVLVVDRGERPTRTVLVASLLLLTRLDLALVAAPLVLHHLRPLGWRARVRAIALGGLPLYAWEAFSLLYYGMLVPNTALAKLATGIDRSTLLAQGVKYYRSLGQWDPYGAALLWAGVGVGLVGRGRRLAIGLLAYGVYLLWIGGDFMAGRFFAVPIVLGAFLLCASPWPGRARQLVALLPLFMLLAPHPRGFAWVRGLGQLWAKWGILDERTYYWSNTGLLERGRARDLDQHYYARFGRQLRGRGVVVESCIGMVGYYAGPSVHIVDPLALADPLLARLPVADPKRFRIGHFERTVPDGYVDSVRLGKNVVADPDLARYWDAVQLVTRGPLLDPARLRATAGLLLGRYDAARVAYVARHPPAPTAGR